MRGNVIGFDPDTNTGAISGHDGQRYDFATNDWRGHNQPRHGDLVDFQAVDRRATDIYLVEPAYVSPSFGQFYFSARGRISRSQYWLKFVVPYFVINMVLQVGVAVTASNTAVTTVFSVVLFIFGLLALWPSLAVLIKRIHDRNKSGWLILALLVPLFLFLILLFVLVGAAIVAGVANETSSDALASLGAFGIVVVVLGLVVLGIHIWFFIEFGCLRGTIGPNRFGPDPVR